MFGSNFIMTVAKDEREDNYFERFPSDTHAYITQSHFRFRKSRWHRRNRIDT